jgi:hypothetical protein
MRPTVIQKVSGNCRLYAFKPPSFITSSPRNGVLV